MATSLAKQLLKLKLPESQAGAKKQIASLLFDPKVAATFDKDTFYALGTNGFQELIKLETPLHDLFYDQLFSEVAADTERSVKSQEYNDELNSTIDHFLLHLSPYFLLRPAQKCIEWLLHRFRIHSYNIESLMKCIFPYYGTNVFVRVVQLLDTSSITENWKNIFESLADGTPLSRNDVVSYCLSNTLFLEFLCDSVLQSVKIHKPNAGVWQMKGWINLFASTILGVIHKSSKIKETFLHHVMPVISKGIMSNLIDFQASCFMIVSQLLIKVHLSPETLDMIVRLTTKYCQPQLQKDASLMIALLFQMQKHYKKLQKWCDEKFAGAITKDMNIFADSCTTVGGKVSVEKQELLQNETSLLSMHFILRVKLKLTSDEIPDLSNSNLLKENSLLSNLWLSPGRNWYSLRLYEVSCHSQDENYYGSGVEELSKKFCALALQPDNQTNLVELYNTLDHCVDQELHIPVLLFLIHAGLRICNKKVFLKTVRLFIKVTKFPLFWDCIETSEYFSNSALENIPKLMKEVNFETKRKLLCQTFLLLWKEVIVKLPFSFASMQIDELLQLNISEKQSEPALIKALFLLLLDLSSCQGSTKVVKFIQEIFSLFISKIFLTPSDILMFLSTFWLCCLNKEWDGSAELSKYFVLSYRLAICLVCKDDGKSTRFQTKSEKAIFDSPFIIPALLLSCTSLNEAIRNSAMQVLRSLAGYASCPYTSFLNHFASYAQEICMDPDQAVQVTAQYFSASKGKKKKEELTLLLSNFVITPLNENQCYFCLKFYEKCLIKVENQAELKVIIPVFENLLNNFNRSDSAATKQQCFILTLWLRKIVSSADPKRESLFLKALSVESECLKEIRDGSLNIRLVSLDLLNGKFFASVSNQTKSEIIDTLISIKADSNNEKTQHAVSKAFKALTVASQLVLDQLKQMGMLSKPQPQKNIIEAKRAKLQQSPCQSHVIKPSEWKRFVVLLEFLHHKKRIQQSEKLIGPFFDILNDLVEKKYTADNLDYVSLLVLGCLLTLFERVKNLDDEDISQLRANIKIELLVRCIHSTQNTQTHQHALMLLARTAQYCPEKVLHSVMSIFTFMGSTILRRDDSYSFQIITQTIKTIIPSLMQMEKKRGFSKNVRLNAVIGILRVFVDSLPYIPTHRRLTVFKELLDELGADVFLWQLMVLLVDQHVSHLSKSSSDIAPEESHSHGDAATKMEESLFMWTSICELFPIKLRIKSVLDILTFLQTYIGHLSDKENPTKEQSPLIDLSKRSTSQMRRFHLVMLTLTSYAIRNIKSTAISPQQSGQEDDASVEKLFESALVYLDHVNEMTEKAEDKSDVVVRYQKNIIRRCNDILEKINSLLSLGTFVERLYELLDVKSITEGGFMLQKLIQLFHRRVAHSGIKFTKDQERGLLKLSERFVAMLSESRNSSASENETALHTAALGLTYISRLTCQKNPKEFIATQPVICDVIEARSLSNTILSSLLVCLSEIVSSLKAHSIGNLKRLCSCFIKLLGDPQIRESNSVYNSLITAINKLFSYLGHFLSPYIEDFLVKLTLLRYIKLQSAPKPASKQASSASESHSKPPQKRQKLASSQDPPSHQLAASVMELIADKVASRVWIPLLQSAYDKIRSEQPLAVRCLLEMVGHHISKLGKEEVSLHSHKIMDFYLLSMNFRNEYKEMNSKEIESVEGISLDGVIAFLIKLPETTFRPLYLKLYDWGSSDNVSMCQSITFYRCVSVMAARLKGLCEIFAPDLLDDICEELKDSPMELCKSATEENEIVKKQSYVLDTLGLILHYCGLSLLSQSIFENILHPLLQQLEIVLSDRARADAYVTKHVIKCVGHLAAASRDNISWRPLNYEILMKTRHDLPNIRCYALECLKTCVENLSENYLVQLPETIPFLAELLEDESDVVENCCQQVIKRMEEVLGEPLQKYF